MTSANSANRVCLKVCSQTEFGNKGEQLQFIESEPLTHHASRFTFHTSRFI
ncbi:hypothetical protein QUF80_12725 [Desulfococcaceae bacterium HSG8]|nr:hypothetical protein [Desulfococcaceae bacterium HSG8]